MSVTLEAEQLKKALYAARKILPDTSSATVILDGRSGTLCLYASDTVLHIAVCLTPVAEPFFGAFYIKPFYAFVETLSVDEITLTMQESRCVITAHKTRATIGLVEDYLLYRPDTSNYVAAFSFSGKDLASIVNDVAFAAERADFGRDMFRCIYVEPEKDCLHFVATNTYKLAERTIYTSHELDTSLLLLAPGMDTVAAIFGASKKVVCAVAPNYRHCYFSDKVITCHFVTHEGLFPQYRKLYPMQETTRCIFPTKELIQAIKRTRMYDSEIVSFRIDGHICTIDAKNKEIGDVETEFSIDPQEYNAYFSVETKRLLNILSHIDTETCVVACDMQRNSRRNAIVFSASDSRVKYCLLPLLEE